MSSVSSVVDEVVLRAIGNFDVYMPFVEHLGFRLLEKRDGTAKVGYDPKPEHFNSWKAIHGGAVMSLLDVALSSACRALDDKCIGCLTVEMKANFIAAATGPVVAAGEGAARGPLAAVLRRRGAR